jgi:hypothetical protein
MNRDQSNDFAYIFCKGTLDAHITKADPKRAIRAMKAFYCRRQNVSLGRWKRVLPCGCFAGLVAGVAGSAIGGSIAQDRIHAGLWEITYTQDGAPSTDTYCITPQQAKVMNSDVATVQVYVEQAVSKENGGVCTVTNFKLQGNTLSLIKACGSGESAFTISLVRIYHGDTAESEVVSKADGRELHIKSKQRRIGVCS